MMRELLQGWGLTEPQLHLVYLGLVAAAAGVTALGTLTLVPRRSHGHLPTRVLGALGVVLSSAALGLAHDGVVAAVPEVAQLFLGDALLLSTTLIALLVAFTAAAPRTALILSATHGLVGVGLLVYLVLWRAEAGDAAWEIQRALDMGVFVLAGYLLLLTVGFLSSRRQGRVTRALYALTAATALVTLARFYHAHPEPGLTTQLIAASPLALGAWIFALSPTGERLLRLRDQSLHLLQRPAALLALAALPVAAAGLALIVGGGAGDAREASRVALFGLDLTPGLMVPFFFAIAAGVFAGLPRSRVGVPAVIALTALTAGLMLLQKEVGNTAVIALTAAVVLLVARGTLVHLLAGGALGVLGVLVAYRLAPVVDAIPYTFHERIHLWLGGADLMRRGGSIVAANHVTFDLGGFWGIGIHRTPGLNLHGHLGALDTDFPMTVVGLYGGQILLSAFILLFICLILLALHTIRCLDFEGDTRRARLHAPILAALISVPAISTLLNLAGAITQSSPFTGVPVAFVSYSVTFTAGAFLVLAFLLLTGNRGALRQAMRMPGADTAPEVDPVEPRAPWRQRVRRWLDPHTWRLGLHRARRHLRLSTLDGGVLLLMLGASTLGAFLIHQLYERYTDAARYHTHPRLVSALTLEPRPDPAGGALRWEITDGPPELPRGPLHEGQRLRLDSLALLHTDGALEVIGSCFPEADFERGVRIGFAGMLDAPDLPVGGELLGGWVDSVAPRHARNDLVLPFGDIALQHAAIHIDEDGHFRVERARPYASLALYDEEGEPLPDDASLRVGQGFGVGTQPERRFRLRHDADAGEICVERADGEALFEYTLASAGPTVIGGRTLLRGRVSGWTVDFEYAERIKAAAEAGVLYAEDGRLHVIPHGPSEREAWDEATARLFYGVFRVARRAQPDGTTAEVLQWNRPFYSTGGRDFDPTRELDAFLIQDERVLGLADSRRFRRPLPRGYDPLEPERHGLLYDRNGLPVTVLDTDARQIRHQLPGGGALIGYAFEGRATRDGLLRVFSPLLRGVEPVPDVEDELQDLLDGRWRGAWGHDVFLTLDRGLQADVHAILDEEVTQLERRSPMDYFHASAIVLGPDNDVLALSQMPDAGPLVRWREVAALKREQRDRPMDAPGLDALHRITTMGSAVKVVLAAAALRNPKDRLVESARGTLYIDARGDGTYSSGGRFRDRGILKSWKGYHLVPLQNYHGKTYGGVVSLRRMLVKSINTAAAYLALNVGRDDYIGIWEDMGLTETVDLLPGPLREDGALGHLVERYRRDPASITAAQIGIIPEDERWTSSYTARLALSGTTDMSIASLAAGVSLIARGGAYQPPRIVAGIRDKKSGEITHFQPAEPTPILSAEDAELLLDMLKDVIHRGTATSFRRGKDGAPREIWTDTAGKTGTGETVVPVKRGARYSRHDKPATRDNKIFVGVYPASSPNPYVVAVVFEQVSHVDKKVAVRSVRRIIQAIDTRYDPRGARSDEATSEARLDPDELLIIDAASLPWNDPCADRTARTPRSGGCTP